MTGISILFVDDEKLIRNSFARELRAEGFTVTTFASSSEAISDVERTKYDLVVTDLMMPGIDGFGVLRAVKRHAVQTSVIILTGYGDQQSFDDAKRLGADGFILKPCNVKDLISRIRLCLEKQSRLGLLDKQSHLQQQKGADE